MKTKDSQTPPRPTELETLRVERENHVVTMTTMIQGNKEMHSSSETSDNSQKVSFCLLPSICSTWLSTESSILKSCIQHLCNHPSPAMPPFLWELRSVSPKLESYLPWAKCWWHRPPDLSFFGSYRAVPLWAHRPNSTFTTETLLFTRIHHNIYLFWASCFSRWSQQAEESPGR